MPKMKKVLVCGYIGYENFGDEALLHVLINNLLQVGYRNEDITVISKEPEKTSQSYNVKSINKWNVFQLFNAFLNNNHVIFIGGLFQDKTSFGSLCYYCLLLIFAGIFQKKVALYAAGIGPIQRGISNYIFNIAINSVSFMTLRDQASAQHLQHKTNAIVTCDPVWTMEPDFSFKPLLSKINWELPILSISLRHDKRLKDYHLTKLSDKVSKILTGMKDWQVVLIPCMPHDDLPVLYELYELIARKSSQQNRIFLIDNFTNFTITQQAGIIASCEVMIGMRYHALLIPLLNGKPVFGLIYDQKVKSLLDFASQIGVSFRDDFEQPWNYFWQNLQYSSNMAKLCAEKTSNLNRTNIQLLETLFNS